MRCRDKAIITGVVTGAAGIVIGITICIGFGYVSFMNLTVSFDEPVLRGDILSYDIIVYYEGNRDTNDVKIIHTIHADNPVITTLDVGTCEEHNIGGEKTKNQFKCTIGMVTSVYNGSGGKGTKTNPIHMSFEVPDDYYKTPIPSIVEKGPIKKIFSECKVVSTAVVIYDYENKNYDTKVTDNTSYLCIKNDIDRTVCVLNYTKDGTYEKISCFT